jgi:hypothetical protein
MNLANRGFSLLPRANRALAPLIERQRFANDRRPVTDEDALH